MDNAAGDVHSFAICQSASNFAPGSASNVDPTGCVVFRRASSGAVLEAPAVVAGLCDVAVVREPVEERCGHLRVGEHAGPFGEAEVRGDDDRGPLVKPADQMEQQLPARLGEGQVAEFVHDNEVDADEAVGDAPLAPELDLRFQPIDQIDDVEEACLTTAPDAAPRDTGRDMALAGAGYADQHDIPLRVEERAGAEALDQFAVDRGAV